MNLNMQEEDRGRNFDDLPVGKSTCMLQLAQHVAGEEERAAIREPTAFERIVRKVGSSVWKTKKEGFQELLALVKEDPSQYDSLEKKTSLYLAQPQTQSLVLRIVQSYLEGGKILSEEPRVIIRTLIEKCLVVEGVSQQTYQLLFMYMDNGQQDTLYHCINECIEHKNPKVSSAALVLISKLINNYGINKLKQLDPFIKTLTALSNVPRPTNKAAQIEMYKEVHKWIGCLKQFPLHHEVRDQVNKFAAGYQMVPMTISRGNKGHKKVFEPMAVQENNQPMDVLTPFSPKWVDETLAIEKWKEKKAALDDFIKKTKTNVIVPREVSHYITLIKRLINDNNINLLLCGLKIVQQLCIGLKKHMAHCARNVFTTVYAKLKDSKNIIVQESQLTLKCMSNCISLQEMSEQIKLGLQDKASNMRVQSLKFLSIFIGNKDNKIINSLRILLQKLIKLTQDGASQVRNQSISILCKLKLHYGIKFFGQKLKMLTDKKLSIIQSSCEDGDSMQDESVSINIGNDEVTHKMVRSTPDMPKQPDIGSAVEARRLSGYHLLSSHPLPPDIITMLKNKACKESSPNVLRAMLAVVKKICQSQPMELELLEFLLIHDWRRCRPMLNEFITTCKFTPSAEQYARNQKLVTHTPNIVQLTNTNTQSTNHFAHNIWVELNGLLTKMSSAIEAHKIEAAEQAIALLSQQNKIESQSQLNQAQYLNVIKCRLSQKNVRVRTIYYALVSQMVRNGLLNKSKCIRFLVPSLLANLQNNPQEIKPLLIKFLATNPQQVFSFFPLQLSNEVLSKSLLQFINEQLDQFRKFAELRRFILPLLHVVVKMKGEVREIAERLLDQVVELEGMQVLEQESRCFKGAQHYLKKWLALPKPHSTKADRLQRGECDPWPISVQPYQIHAFVQELISLGGEFQVLATPFALAPQQFKVINNLEESTLIEYSDLLLKWVLWRVQVDKKECVYEILRLAVRIVRVVKEQISEVEVVILLSALLNALKFNRECLDVVCQVCVQLEKIQPSFKEKCVRFWINSLSDVGMEGVPINQILKLFVRIYQQTIPQELVTLARIPQTLNCIQFKNYLKKNFDQRLLNVYGFKNLQKQIEQNQLFLSNTGEPQNAISISLNEFTIIRNIFMKSSQQLMQRINEMLQSSSQVVQLHLKIIHSITVPFLSKQIPFINGYTYFKNLQTDIINSYKNNERMQISKHLSSLLRLLLYLMIDLNDARIENKKQLTRIVNKILLIIFQNESVSHLLQILFSLFKSQLKCSVVNYKLLSLLPKCISKVSANYHFKDAVDEFMKAILQETKQILNTSEEPVLHKVFKNMLADIAVNNAQAMDILALTQLDHQTPAFALLLKEAEKGAREKKDSERNISRELIPSITDIKKANQMPEPHFQRQII